MGHEKLAKRIYSLAMEVESGHAKVAERFVRFTDENGMSFMLPYEVVGMTRRMYSPYDRSWAERDGIFNLQLPKLLGEAFGGGVVEASTKVAEKLVKFKDQNGRVFVLPFADVGTQRWAYSPWDRSRAERVDIFNVQLSGKMEEVLPSTPAAPAV